MAAESAINNSLLLSLTLHRLRRAFREQVARTSGGWYQQNRNFIPCSGSTVRSLVPSDCAYEQSCFTTTFSFRRRKQWYLEHCGSARELMSLASSLCVYKSPHFPFFSSLQLLKLLYHPRSTVQEGSRSFQASCLPSMRYSMRPLRPVSRHCRH